MKNRRAIRVLLSEGSSLSARQAITALGQCGYTIDICDPNPQCISRFSRFVRRYYRCPAAGTDPIGYLRFMLHLLTRERYDVLLPVHEQAFLFAKVQHRLKSGAGVALAPFDAFLQVQGKVAFAHLMQRLSLPTPSTSIIGSRAELAAVDRFPRYIKTDYSTAGQGVWRVTDRVELERVGSVLQRRGLLGGARKVVVQDVASGVQCQVQAVFAHGHLLAAHSTQTRGVSAGGGHSARMGVDHPQVRNHLAIVGKALAWHGPLALDYFFDEASESPSYIEANPRLVEPMNAALSGVNLADLTVQLALGEMGESDKTRVGRMGIRSHSLLAILVGIAAGGGLRRDVLRTLVQAIRGRGVFAESREDLTPFFLDPPSLIPLALVIGRLLVSPSVAQRLATGTVNTYSLTTAAIEAIIALDEVERGVGL
jgi:predicted ATP-grasp superfamily ATP-dependent carboligase